MKTSSQYVINGGSGEITNKNIVVLQWSFKTEVFLKIF